ncbi:hypothetical protein H310_03738 [Aphanomyces invadans]|uniref:Uncharacterized protein n=1 Tax=Aphanomyces invadans TaxID=157072 RepID=A0A024UIY2_9STRA|nr:hypothetical protein H310_03738 [Aphanomyces invadans]ETW06155.1 hypothetical protein H310_03738 [Aphanomyces invadans]RHY15603.1 hypothetical protein DYB32_010743 [Aphanomyces invadans]|eukprot:XP_008865932.1 hypothetical protein H310_03738 [Aphanomyces invadans]
MVVVVRYIAADHKYIPFAHEWFGAFAALGVGFVLVSVDFRSGGVLHSATMTPHAPPQVMPLHENVPLLHAPKRLEMYGTSP